MASYLDELYGHQEWADAEHWRALEKHQEALADEEIRERLHHIHQVQAAFLWVVGPRTEKFVITKVEDYPAIGDLKIFARKYHADMAAKLGEIDDVALEETIEAPWFQPAAKISVRQALTQTAMHSHYHRGQNVTRMRKLGVTPPGTDFIVWLWQGQPKPRWD